METELRVAVRLLGALELENSRGRLLENSARQPRPWLLLKYLLLNPGRAVGFEELRAAVWPEDPADDKAPGAARVRLRRLREGLEPLGLGGTQGLVLYKNGAYSLNPAYSLETDTDALARLESRLEGLPPQAPEGLDLALEALELFRGPFLGETPPAPWLSPYRSYYRTRFGALARDCLARMRALGDSRPAATLCRRAAELAPGDAALQKEILAYLMEQRLELELLRYVPRLSRSGADWLP